MASGSGVGIGMALATATLGLLCIFRYRAHPQGRVALPYWCQECLELPVRRSHRGRSLRGWLCGWLSLLRAPQAKQGCPKLNVLVSGPGFLEALGPPFLQPNLYRVGAFPLLDRDTERLMTEVILPNCALESQVATLPQPETS